METPEGGDGKKGASSEKSQVQITPLSHSIIIFPYPWPPPSLFPSWHLLRARSHHTRDSHSGGGGGEDGTGHNRRKWAPIFPVLFI